MAANIVCSNTGRTAHVWDGPSYERPGATKRNIVARCGKTVKVAVVVSYREFLDDDYIACDRCNTDTTRGLP